MSLTPAVAIRLLLPSTTYIPFGLTKQTSLHHKLREHAECQLVITVLSPCIVFRRDDYYA